MITRRCCPCAGRAREGPAALLGSWRALILVAPAPALAAGGHVDPVVPVLGPWRSSSRGQARRRPRGPPRAARRARRARRRRAPRQPGLGLSRFEVIKTDTPIDILAGLGVLILLFEVGLESTVGRDAEGRVALAARRHASAWSRPSRSAGASAPGSCPEHSVYVHAFLGATLTATSVGITARVLKDLGRSQTTEARIILGAAVIDDVLGLVILAVVGGDHRRRRQRARPLVLRRRSCIVLGKAVAVPRRLAGARRRPLAAALSLWRRGSRARGVLLATALAFCFVLSWLVQPSASRPSSAPSPPA